MAGREYDIIGVPLSRGCPPHLAIGGVFLYDFLLLFTFSLMISTAMITKQIALLAISGILPVIIPLTIQRALPALTKYLTILADFMSIPEALNIVAHQR